MSSKKNEKLEKTKKPNKVSKGIPIDPKIITIEESETVKDLLKRAKATKPEKTEKKKKETRGRPKKVKKPTSYDPKAYEQNLIAKTLDSFLIRLGNGLLGIAKKMPLTEKEKLTNEDIMIGEAICYTMDYYGIGIDHPIFVMILAVGAFSWTLFDKTQELKEQKTTEEWQKWQKENR